MARCRATPASSPSATATRRRSPGSASVAGHRDARARRRALRPDRAHRRPLPPLRHRRRRHPRRRRGADPRAPHPGARRRPRPDRGPAWGHRAPLRRASAPGRLGRGTPAVAPMEAAGRGRCRDRGRAGARIAFFARFPPVAENDCSPGSRPYENRGGGRGLTPGSMPSLVSRAYSSLSMRLSRRSWRAGATPAGTIAGGGPPSMRRSSRGAGPGGRRSTGGEGRPCRSG